MDDSGNIVASYRYDEFGVTVGEWHEEGFDQPYRFSTKRYYDGFGISYYGFRFYEPAIGRWLTRDPIGIRGGLNLYGAMGNSAVNWVDKFGLHDGPEFDNGVTITSETSAEFLELYKAVNAAANLWNQEGRIPTGTNRIDQWGSEYFMVDRWMYPDKDDPDNVYYHEQTFDGIIVPASDSRDYYSKTHHCSLYADSLAEYLKKMFANNANVNIMEVWQEYYIGGHQFVIVEINGMAFKYDPWRANPGVANDPYLHGQEFDWDSGDFEIQ